MPFRTWFLPSSLWATPGGPQQVGSGPAGALARPQARADIAATKPLLPHHAPPSPSGLPSERPTHRRRCAFVAAVVILVLAIVAALVVAALEQGGGSSGGGATGGSVRSNAQIPGGGTYPVDFFAVSVLPSTMQSRAAGMTPWQVPLTSQRRLPAVENIPACVLLGQLPARLLRLWQVGDWGRQGGQNQTQVAELMGRVAEAKPPQFVVSVGGEPQRFAGT